MAEVPDAAAAAATCGCKGCRFCALCEHTERVQKLRKEEDKYAHYDVFVYNADLQKAVRCPALNSQSTFEDIQAASSTPSSAGDAMEFDGLMLILEFLSVEEEAELMNTIDNVEWAESQSGRRKQDYGPQVNFKHKKVKTTKFIGMPHYADMLLSKMRAHSESRLGRYQPFEMCNLEYEESKKSAIEMHQDDMWIWGNRLISINLLSGSVMTMANESARQLCFVWMPHRSLLCMADTARYSWKHGVLSHHIRGRRIALTMRESAPEFQEGGELYEKFGKELIRIGNLRVDLSKPQTA